MKLITFSNNPNVKEEIKEHFSHFLPFVHLAENIFQLIEIHVRDNHVKIMFNFHEIEFEFHIEIRRDNFWYPQLYATKNDIKMYLTNEVTVLNELSRTVEALSSTARDQNDTKRQLQLQYQRVVEYIANHIETIEEYLKNRYQEVLWTDKVKKLSNKHVSFTKESITIQTEHLNESQIILLIEKYQEILGKNNG